MLLDANAAVAVAVRINPVPRPRRRDVPQRARRRGGPHAKRPRPAARRVARPGPYIGIDLRIIAWMVGWMVAAYTALLVLVMPGLSADMTAVAATVAATGAIIFGAMYMPWNRARRAVVAAHGRRRERHAVLARRVRARLVVLGGRAAGARDPPRNWTRVLRINDGAGRRLREVRAVAPRIATVVAVGAERTLCGDRAGPAVVAEAVARIAGAAVGAGERRCGREGGRKN